MIFGKRVLSLCCAFLILFTAANTAYAEDDTAANAVSEEYGHKIEVLNALGITDVQENGFSIAAPVTREMFSKGIAAMMIDDISALSIEPVGDLDADDTGMLYLMSVGIIKGTEENVYEPDSNVTLEQAAKIAVSALGFDDVAAYKGGYSSGYVTEGRRIGLLDGISISQDAELCMGDYIKLLYNLLDIDVLEPESFGGVNTYQRVDGNTLIYVYRNISKGKGLVSANKFSGLYSKDGATYDESVEIDGEYYQCGETKAEDYLGIQSEFYYYDFEDGTEKTLLYITPAKENKRLLIDYDDLSYSAGVYTYTNERGTSKKIQIPSNAVIMYNGVFQSEFDKIKFVPSYGSVEFVSNDGDSSYEVIKIQDIALTIVLSVATDGTAIYDKYDTDNNIYLEEEEEYSVTLANGKEGTVYNINKDNIVEAVKIEYDGRWYYKLRVVTNSVTGTIQSIEAGNEADGEIYVDNEKYTVSSRLEELLERGDIFPPSLGKEYVFLLNSKGEIADITDGSEKAFRLGYFKRFSVVEDEELEEKRMIKLFDESGAWEYYELAEKIKLNGSSVKSNDISGMDIYIGKVCKYELNVAGEVTSLYFPSETDKKFRAVFSMKEPYYRRYYGSPVFGPKSLDDGITCSIKSSAVVFVIPNAAENIDERIYSYQYAVIPPSKLANYTSFGNVDIYNTDGDIGIGDVAVVTMKAHGYATNLYSTRPVLVNKCRSYWDDGEMKTEVTALTNGNEIKFLVEDLRTNGADLPFGPGDLIFCFFAKDGTLRLYDDAKYYHMLLDYDDENPVFTKAFDWSSGSTIGVSYRASMAADVRIRYGSVYKTDGQYLWFNTAENPSDISGVEATNYATARIYVYDKDTKKYALGKASDIVGYTSDSADYSKAVIVYSDSYTEIVIY